MNIHEYQAKALLSGYGVAVPMGRVAESAPEALAHAQEIMRATGCDAVAVKAQIHAGGRGKGGGVRIAQTPAQAAELTGSMIGMQLVTPQTGPQGKRVSRVLVEQGIYTPGPSAIRELYVSVLLNRAAGRHIILYSPQGGMDIEAVAASTPHLIHREEVHPLGLQPFQARRIAFNLGLSGRAHAQMVQFVLALYRAYTATDATLMEINPVVKTSDDRILAADAKVSIDDNALARQPELAALRDTDEEDPAEREASEANLNFIKLSGNVGCMVNGAGLAMATMDIIQLSGGEPANFLDVGGSANAQTVAKGFRLILRDPHVRAILVNIFGGIVRCDRVAQGVVDAYRELGAIPVPIIVRLQGTRAMEGKAIIDGSGLQVLSAISLQEAAERVGEVVR